MIDQIPRQFRAEAQRTRRANLDETPGATAGSASGALLHYPCGIYPPKNAGLNFTPQGFGGRSTANELAVVPAFHFSFAGTCNSSRRRASSAVSSACTFAYS